MIEKVIIITTDIKLLKKPLVMFQTKNINVEELVIIEIIIIVEEDEAIIKIL